MIRLTKNRLNMQEKIKELYNYGESTLTLGKRFNKSDGTIRYHLIKEGLKLRDRKRATMVAIEKNRWKEPIRRQHKIPMSSQELTKEKAYILGVLCGDGYMQHTKNKRGTSYIVALQSIDKEFVRNFSRLINKVYKLKPKESFIKVKNPNWNDKYQSRICSKEVFEDLQRYDKTFKTFEWEVPKQILNSSKKIQAKFLQGFFDSEGHVNYKYKNIIGVSASLQGINGVKRLLNNIAIAFTDVNYKNRSIYGIRVQGRKSIKIFNKNVGFIIKRKKNSLKILLSTYIGDRTAKVEVIGLKNKMVQLRDENMPYQKIANILGVSRCAVWNQLNKKRE